MGRAMRARVAVVLLATPAGLAAQTEGEGTVVGRVVSEEGEPLASANVAVRTAADSVIVDGTLAAADGRFEVGGLEAGRYIVAVTYVGYAATESELIALGPGETVDVGTFRLGVSAVDLEEISVQSERSPAVFEADRTIYSTTDMPAVAGGSATELFQNIPSLEVNIDGEVSMEGATPAIYINDRPAPMEGEALVVFLEQFPADRIERVEIIPNPSARYDAEGSGGIINIVLDEDAELGVTGSVFANIGTRGRSGGGGRASYQRGDLTLSGGTFLRYSDRDRTSYDLRQNLVVEPTTYLRQDSWSERNGLSGAFDLSMEYQLSERARVWTEGRAMRFGNESEGVRTTTHMDADQAVTLRYDRRSTSSSDRLSGDVATGFLYEFGERDHELEFELEIEADRDGEDERVETVLDSIVDEAEYVPAALMLDDDSEREREITLEGDYQRPLGAEGRLELGYRGRVDDRASDRVRRSIDPSVSEETVEDLGFDHRRVYNSGYLTVTRPVGPLGVQLGARAERADMRFTIPTGETFHRTYNSLFPSANISYDFGNGRQMRVSYSRRIRRPDARILDPTDRSNDPLNREVGNPEIDPQYTHSFRADARWTGTLGTLRLAPYYRRTTGDWERIRTVDENGVSTETWENLAWREHYGARLTGSVRRMDRWGGYLSLGARREVRGADNLSEAYSGSSFRWSTRANLNFEIMESLSAQTRLSYTPPRDVAQGRVGSRVRMNFGLRQRLLDDRASIRLSVVDPFDLYESSFETRDPTHIQIGTSEVSRRRARLNFSYSFGGGGGDGGGRRGRRGPGE